MTLAAAVAVCGGGLLQHLAGQLPQPLQGPVGLLGGVRPDLGAIHRDHPQPAQPRGRAHVQHLREQVLQRPVLAPGALPEPAQRGMVRELVPRRDPEARIHPGPVLDLPGGPHPARHRVHHQRGQHLRVIARPAPARARAGLQGGGIQLPGHLNQEPDKMVLRHPRLHIQRQKHRLLPVHREILTAHKTHPARQNTRQAFATRPIGDSIKTPNPARSVRRLSIEAVAASRDFVACAILHPARTTRSATRLPGRPATSPAGAPRPLRRALPRQGRHRPR